DHVQPPGGLACLRDVPAGVVAGAGVDDFALFHEDIDGLVNLFPRRVAVDVVHLVQIDAIGLEPAEAAFARLADMQGAAAAIVHASAHTALVFGGEDDLLALVTVGGEPAAEDLLRDAFVRFSAAPPSVDVGGVPEVDSLADGFGHDGVGVFFA